MSKWKYTNNDGKHIINNERGVLIAMVCDEDVAIRIVSEHQENERLRKELEEARKVAKIYRKATSDIHNTLRWGDSENALERVETIIELALGQEGEGNQ